MAGWPHERSLVEKLKNEPFALIGVHCWVNDPAELKSVMQRENIQWRTFMGRGAIASQWNNPATPAYYLLDAQGIIRGKWVGNPGETVKETSIETLIQEIKTASTPKDEPNVREQ